MRAVVAVATAVAAVAVAGAAFAADTLVRPGKGVGKFALGMSDKELRRAVGRPTYVIDKGGNFGRRRVEYQYGAGAAYTVELAGTPGRLRVVSILTQLRGQRLPNGFGVGTRERTLMKTYGARLRCVPWKTYVEDGRRYVGEPRLGAPYPTRTCSVPGPAGAATVFVSKLPGWETQAEYIPQAIVLEVGVRATVR